MQTGDRLPEKFSTICRPIYKHRVCGIKDTEKRTIFLNIFPQLRKQPFFTDKQVIEMLFLKKQNKL